jgi:hypothetical protein
MTAWTDAVSAEFKLGRKTNPKFSLKMAMMKAKKSYKKMGNSTGKTMRKRGGAPTTSPPAVAVAPPAIVSNHMVKGGARRKSRKSRK